MSKIYHSQETDHWGTPDSMYRKLDDEFLFDFDPCPDRSDFDGLVIEWGDRNFINPPFSEWPKWVKKGIEEAEKGKLCVFLLAARTSTICFHEDIIPHAKEIRFIKGRLKYKRNNGGVSKSAPFGSMIVVFDGSEVS